MKFLCRNCKAKYQIADEKVAGRTLRMTCQQCGEPIVVRGPARQAQATGARAIPAGVVAPAAIGAPVTSTLVGADLAHRVTGPARELATAPEEWHVAINDAPVGPLRRDEVARMISQGAVDRESLAWREGMDDWLAIRHIAELSTLFGQSIPAHGSAAVSLASASPASRGDLAPIGGRQVVPVESYAPSPEPEPPEVAVATLAQTPAPAESPKGQPRCSECACSRRVIRRHRLQRRSRPRQRPPRTRRRVRSRPSPRNRRWPTTT
jgi:predicted Zn finger-like uncharacterized protein